MSALQRVGNQWAAVAEERNTTVVLTRTTKTGVHFESWAQFSTTASVNNIILIAEYTSAMAITTTTYLCRVWKHSRYIPSPKTECQFLQLLCSTLTMLIMRWACCVQISYKCLVIGTPYIHEIVSAISLSLLQTLQNNKSNIFRRYSAAFLFWPAVRCRRCVRTLILAWYARRVSVIYRT